MDYNSYLPQFYTRLTNARKSENTIRSYRTSLAHFFPNGDVCLDPQYIESKLSELSHLSANSLKTKLAPLAEFIKYINRYTPVPHFEDLLEITRSIKREEVIPDTITKEQFEAILGTTDNLRDKAMVKLLGTSGCRVSELVNLKTVDLKDDYMIARDTKNGKDRKVYLPKCTVELLQKYISVFQPKEYLFVPVKGSKPNISEDAVRLMLRTIGDKLRLHLHPHSFRRYYATTQAAAGVSVNVLQKNLGHSSPLMSIHYVETVGEDQRKSAEVFEED